MLIKNLSGISIHMLNVLFIEVLWPYLFDYVLDKSFDLKYVIQQMLDPDPGSRPTVDQVLAFPYVRKVSAIHWEGLYKFNRDWLCTVKIENGKIIILVCFHSVLHIVTCNTFDCAKLVSFGLSIFCLMINCRFGRGDGENTCTNEQ